MSIADTIRAAVARICSEPAPRPRPLVVTPAQVEVARSVGLVFREAADTVPPHAPMGTCGRCMRRRPTTYVRVPDDHYLAYVSRCAECVGEPWWP